MFDMLDAFRNSLNYAAEKLTCHFGVKPHVKWGLCVSVCRCEWFSDIFYLIVTDEFLVRDVGREICVQKCTESQAVTPAAAEVGDINILKEKPMSHKQLSRNYEELRVLTS